MSIDNDARFAANRKDGAGGGIVLGLQLDDRRLALSKRTLSLDGVSTAFKPSILADAACKWNNVEDFNELRKWDASQLADSKYQGGIQGEGRDK